MLLVRHSAVCTVSVRWFSPEKGELPGSRVHVCFRGSYVLCHPGDVTRTYLMFATAFCCSKAAAAAVCSHKLAFLLLAGNTRQKAVCDSFVWISTEKFLCFWKRKLY